jgi:hypothetical protein
MNIGVLVLIHVFKTPLLLSNSSRGRSDVCFGLCSEAGGLSFRYECERIKMLLLFPSLDVKTPIVLKWRMLSSCHLCCLCCSLIY